MGPTCDRAGLDPKFVDTYPSWAYHLPFGQLQNEPPTSPPRARSNGPSGPGLRFSAEVTGTLEKGFGRMDVLVGVRLLGEAYNVVVRP
ncbi:hypothetical protein BD779DRAFT_296075 [Infundibulicybe gibba]|nr:hypothetical protein BD779DRAFT_296075 [Infundibulicybe gibba]